MKSLPALALSCLVLPALLLLFGCDGESPTKAIPRTEATLNDYALTQVYQAASLAGGPLDVSSLKSQIDPLIGQYGEEQVVDKIKEIAADNSDPATRATATFSIQPYVSATEYNGMVDALDNAARSSFDELTQ